MEPNDQGLVALEMLHGADGLNAGEVGGFTPRRAKELVDAGVAKLAGVAADDDGDEPARRRGRRRSTGEDDA